MSSGIWRMALAGLVALSCVAQSAPPKKKVAILDFEYGTVQGGVSAIFGANVDIGKGIADMLVEKLVQGGVYTVFERKALDKVMAEQNLSNSDRADATTAAKIGKLLGVDAIILGSITQFGRDDKQTSVGGGAFGGMANRYGLGGIGKKEAKAVVAISARVIGTDTAQIYAAFTGKGESKRSGASLLGAGGSYGAGAGAAISMGSTQFANSILGEATAQAVAQTATQLQGSATSIPGHARAMIEGLVADVSGNSVTLNVGKKAGVALGDRFDVVRVTREIKDPASGKVIRRVEDRLGSITITEVDDLSAVGTFAGSSPLKVGDAVKTAN
ncbi:CsgG/HfaB family protein [uncultured Paludibaculum sp.]|uniref:CsgG/HfaB family protein n=1 Tax=uncultured Paludibaculum sp. TaxID=1765020 RepID=UPI002AAAA739|nr:CsgG/HfaB family protein [uncultured Paludibaculum sp.]